MRHFLFALGFAWSIAAPAHAATISGTLVEPAIVWADGGAPALAQPVDMNNSDKAFVPDRVVVTAGSDVRFPNSDAFFHSVFSRSTPDPFDIGFYFTGPGKLVHFSTPGVIDVRCHIHGLMHATIIVVDGPFVDEPGTTYRLLDARPGKRVLHAWSPRAGERTMTVIVPQHGDVTISRAL